MSLPKNKRLSVGAFRFVVFSGSAKYRCESESLMTTWDDELAGEWLRNLAILRKSFPRQPDDAERLRDAERWMKSKGGDE